MVTKVRGETAELAGSHTERPPHTISLDISFKIETENAVWYYCLFADLYAFEKSVQTHATVVVVRYCVDFGHMQ